MPEHFQLNYVTAMLGLVSSISPFLMADAHQEKSAKLPQGTPLGGFYTICDTHRFSFFLF